MPTCVLHRKGYHPNYVLSRSSSTLLHFDHITPKTGTPPSEAPIPTNKLCEPLPHTEVARWRQHIPRTMDSIPLMFSLLLSAVTAFLNARGSTYRPNYHPRTLTISSIQCQFSGPGVTRLMSPKVKTLRLMPSAILGYSPHTSDRWARVR